MGLYTFTKSIALKLHWQIALHYIRNQVLQWLTCKLIQLEQLFFAPAFQILCSRLIPILVFVANKSVNICLLSSSLLHFVSVQVLFENANFFIQHQLGSLNIPSRVRCVRVNLTLLFIIGFKLQMNLFKMRRNSFIQILCRFFFFGFRSLVRLFSGCRN